MSQENNNQPTTKKILDDWLHLVLQTTETPTVVNKVVHSFYISTTVVIVFSGELVGRFFMTWIVIILAQYCKIW